MRKSPELDIWSAARAGDLVRMKAFLAKNPSLLDRRDRDNFTPLLYAVWKGSKDSTAFLLTRGADVNARGRTPLHETACSLFEVPGTLVELLISKGASVNEKDRNGDTPLHLTASPFGSSKIAELLISHDAIVNVRNNRKKTPLKMAEENRREDVSEVLRRHGGEEE